MTELILSFLQQYPQLAVFISIVGALRIVVKPIMTALHAIAGVTPTESDDKFLQAVENSKFFKTFLYLLDWFASVKVKK